MQFQAGSTDWLLIILGRAALQSVELEIQRSLVLVKCLNQTNCKTSLHKIHFSPTQVCSRNQGNTGSLTTSQEHVWAFLRSPHRDLFAAQAHYCLKIKIHGAHPLHTCDWFPAVLRRRGRNGVATARPFIWWRTKAARRDSGNGM